MPARPSIRLSFLGGAGAIGASSALVQVAGTSLLIDCGVRFRTGQALPDLDLLTGKALDAILVTHAHSDHTGALPVVHEAFPAAPIYMTPPTRDLVGILQRDALKIMSTASEREDEIPLYGERQVESMIERIRPIDHQRSVTIGEVVVTYLPACHILGASMVHLQTPGGNVLFTGDYSVTAQKTVPLLGRPTLPVDLLVSEATYGNRLHADRRLAESRLAQTIAEVVEGGGRVLIPAFAIGRAQEVLLILKEAIRKKQMPAVPVFADGMVRAVCGVYAQHEGYLTPSLAREIRASGHPFYTKEIQPVKSPADRKSVLDAGPCVIVASSGMLHGGPSAFYAADLAPRDKDAILITGYQDEESPGAGLLRLAAQKGPRTLRLGERVVEVRCRFEPYSLSAHADRTQMMGLIEAIQPSTVVLVHGDREAKEGLAASLDIADVVFAEDGDQITRTYKPRARSTRSLGSLPRGKSAASLVGPAGDSALSPAALAEAWFGREVSREVVDRLVDALIEAGVARRDEEDPARLRSQVNASPAVSARDLEEENEAQALKAENPKGRLFELCMRRRLAPPEEEYSAEGDLHRIELRLMTPEGLVSSGPLQASSKRLAEQRAARALLERLGGEGPEVSPVSEEQEMRLKQQNPKGRLIELSTQLGLGAPVFEVAPTVAGFAGRVRLAMPDEPAWVSGMYGARQAKVVEQAAAGELLGALAAYSKGESPRQEGALGVPSGTGSERSISGKDPRMQLNEMRQLGLIQGYGYELVEQRGPSHQPIFVLRGWIEPLSGERVKTEEVEARSKKEGEMAASAPLLALAVRVSGAR